MPIDDLVRDAIDAFITRSREDLDVRLRDLTSELLRLVHEQEEALRAEWTREMGGKTGLGAGGDARRDTLDRLLACVRRLDDSTTLSGILETLAKGAAADRLRVAVLLVDGELLRNWANFGFPAGDVPVEVPIAHARGIAAAVALRQTSFIQPPGDGRDSSAPAFMRLPAGHTGIVVPIVVGSEVVAVLYADDVDRLPEQGGAPAWMEEIELLVRHASLRLENVTSMQTVELLTKPA